MTTLSNPGNPELPSPSAPPNALPARDSTQTLFENLSIRFDVVEKQLRVGKTLFTLLKVRDTNKLIDSIAPETFSVDERLPYWADIWTSAIELARYCIEDADLKGIDVLELGCGLGLAGIAAAKAGANVVLSDYEEDALAFARCNADRNLPPEVVHSRLRFVNLDWRRIDESLPQPQKFDMIIAADVVYERRNFFPLMDVLQRLLRPGGFAFFTEPDRAIGDHFINLLREAGFGVTVTDCNVELDGKTTNVRRIAVQSGKIP